MIKFCLPISLVLTLAAIMSSCSPIPVLQSPHINSKFAISSSIKSNNQSNVNGADEDVKSKQRFIVDETLPFISLGLFNRVELSGILFPYFVYGLMWQGNAKVALFDIGKDNFKNIAGAVFGGWSGYNGEHDDRRNYYAGLSLSTTVQYGLHEFELIAQSSYAKEYFASLESDEYYTIYWIQPAAGILYTPLGWQRRFQFSIGANYSHPVNSSVAWETYNTGLMTSTGHYSTFSKGGVSCIVELRYNIIR